MRYIFDIESDGLLDTVSKIYVLYYYNLNTKERGSIHDYEEIRNFIRSSDTLIGHNIIRYDIPVLEKILGIKVKSTLIDTLPLSWYLFPDRVRHGLELWGEYFGVPKPIIRDWKNLSLKEYTHRCKEDVRINLKLYEKCMQKLNRLYGGVDKDINRIISYLTFKMECAREQEEVKWKLNKTLCQQTIDELTILAEEKVNTLTKAMPMVPKYVERTKPDKPFKKDGTLSVAGAKWFNLLREHNLTEDYTGSVTQLISEEPPNPNSSLQVKDWLFSLGWKPLNFDYKKDGDKERKIPQIRIEGDDGKELCPSVKKLVSKEPAIEVLEGLTVIQHRLGILNGFMNNENEGYLQAEVSGLTNTMRFKHKTLVNLPGVSKPYGDIIRGVLIAEENEMLCGSDMSSLESMTKRHYMYPYDPDYVNEMSEPGFDEHLDLAVYAKALTQKQVDELGPKHPDVAPIRKMYKPANYACIYGVRARRLSRTTGLSERVCEGLIEAYWERNWAIKEVIKNATIQYIGTEMWLLNPVSGFYMSLRYEKDIFSTLNQSTGVYCFDLWVRKVRQAGYRLKGQFHDEIIVGIPTGPTDPHTQALKECIKEVNDEIKLNVQLDIDVQFGETYADIH